MPRKVKSWELDYLQALRTKSIGGGPNRFYVKIQEVRQSEGYGEWCLKLK